MKILEVTFYLAAGGGERLLVDLSNEFAKEHEVTILTLKDDQIEPEKRQFYKPELSPKVVYKNLGLTKGLNLKMLIKVYKAIKNENADIVHLHVRGVPMYCLLALLFLRGPKFYQTVHSDINNGYTDRFYNIMIKTLGYSGRMGFIALSKTNYDDLIKAYPKIKATCIVNGRAPILPTKSFDNVKRQLDSFKINENTVLFIHVARCNPVKNQIMLVEAFNEFVKHGVNAALVIVGDNFDSELGRTIKAKACEKIHFMGPHLNVSDYILNSDVFCLSSTYEGMPISMLEASLAGKPIVSTPVCGARDLIIDGKNGIKSIDYTIKNYVDALGYAYTNFSLLSDYSLKMRGNSPYTIKVCATRYIDFFSKPKFRSLSC